MTRELSGARVVNIGFGNIVSVLRIVTIVTPDSAPIKRLKEDAQKKGKLIDATQGRRTRSVIITDSDHVILSALQVETVTQRMVTAYAGNFGEKSSNSGGN
jgi:regulator of extracellular matrix RemA (YlzA/DUF370 family)